MRRATVATGPARSGPASGERDVPTPTLLMGALTAVATGGFVAWALLPLPYTVAGLPAYAVAAVATTLWSGIAFLRRALPTGVLAEGFYLMAVAVLMRPVAVSLSVDGVPAALRQPGGAFASTVVALVVAGVLLVAGWRLDARAQEACLRRMRRRVRRGMSSRRATNSPLAGGRSEESERSEQDG
jgi:hypothetical protein